ncbi:hypothetical protein C5S32_07120 [ANME-1 cluster archaeon GoMg1]|nr:hypothetical protein [ANME-1 cluster archaeon GoMg1]VUT25972.1 MAG: hypothetical protein MASP_01257 [Candidatus Methanolliviera sp. GoM_asphalt]
MEKMSKVEFNEIKEKIRPITKEYDIKKGALFGSLVRGELQV